MFVIQSGIVRTIERERDRDREKADRERREERKNTKH